MKQMKNVKCIVFDLDGTLTNTLNAIAFFGNSALNKYGFPSIQTDRYRYLAGNGAEILVKRMLREIDKLSDDNFERVYKYYNEIYDADPNYLSGPYEGINEVLGVLCKRGIKKAVCSNKPQYPVQNVVKTFFEDYHFEVVCGATKDKPKKPDPSVLFEILNKLDVSLDECVYIGDSNVDMQTGKNAGVFTIGAAWGFRTEEELREAGADVIAHKPLDILKILGLEKDTL